MSPFNRGFMPRVSGDTLRLRCDQKFTEILLEVELNGLLYVIERLSVGIEECRFINLPDEGYSKSHFAAVPKRRRNCYRIDEEQMNVEIQEDDQIFMIFYLTFIFIESQ
jgi:hypothetical protein